MPSSAFERVDAFIQAGELEDACNILDDHLSDHPDDTDALRLQAELLLRLPGRASDALRNLDAIPEPSADDYLLRASAYEALGDADAVFAAIEQAWTLARDLRMAEILLDQLYQRGETDRALKLLADLPKTWRWLARSADFYALAGDDVTAEAHYCSALDDLAQNEPNPLRNVQRAYLLLKRAEIYRRLKRWADADADYAASEALMPGDPTIPMKRAELAVERDDL